MESSAVKADDNPGIWEQDVRLLEGLDIFESDPKKAVNTQQAISNRVMFIP